MKLQYNLASLVQGTLKVWWWKHIRFELLNKLIECVVIWNSCVVRRKLFWCRVVYQMAIFLKPISIYLCCVFMSVCKHSKFDIMVTWLLIKNGNSGFTREPMYVFTYVQMRQILKRIFCIKLFEIRYSCLYHILIWTYISF